MSNTSSKVFIKFSLEKQSKNFLSMNCAKFTAHLEHPSTHLAKRINHSTKKFRSSFSIQTRLSLYFLKLFLHKTFQFLVSEVGTFKETLKLSTFKYLLLKVTRARNFQEMQSFVTDGSQYLKIENIDSTEIDIVLESIDESRRLIFDVKSHGKSFGIRSAV